MNTAEYNALHIVHVFSVIALVATMFYACAGAPETRKKIMIWSGVAALLALLTGLRMWQAQYGFSGHWPVVKLVCWLGLASLGGMAYRRRDKAGLWLSITLVLTLVALVMVYTKPF